MAVADRDYCMSAVKVEVLVALRIADMAAFSFYNFDIE
jgi:hypothetical protein